MSISVYKYMLLPERSWQFFSCPGTSPCTALYFHVLLKFSGSSWQTDPELPSSPPPDALQLERQISLNHMTTWSRTWNWTRTENTSQHQEDVTWLMISSIIFQSFNTIQFTTVIIISKQYHTPFQRWYCTMMAYIVGQLYYIVAFLLLVGNLCCMFLLLKCWERN